MLSSIFPMNIISQCLMLNILSCTFVEETCWQTLFEFLFSQKEILFNLNTFIQQPCVEKSPKIAVFKEFWIPLILCNECSSNSWIYVDHFSLQLFQQVCLLLLLQNQLFWSPLLSSFLQVGLKTRLCLPLPAVLWIWIIQTSIASSVLLPLIVH